MNSSTITRLSDVLKYFLNHAYINAYYDNISINLLDYFPLLKHGYGTYNAVYLIMRNYIDINHLTDTKRMGRFIADELLIDAFTNPIHYKRNSIITLIEKSKLNELNVRDIVKMNIYATQEFSDDKNYIAKLNYEHDLARDIWALIKLNSYSHVLQSTQIRNHGTKVLCTGLPKLDINVIIPLAITHGNNNIIEQFMMDTSCKLLCAIIIQKYDIVRKFLNEIDPRINDNQSYKLALRYKNTDIINAIKRKIIEKNWYEKEALNEMFKELCAGSNLGDTIYMYIRGIRKLCML